MAGYSERPLHAKLGIAAGATITLLGAPRGYRANLAPLPPRVRIRTTLGRTAPLIQIFCARRTPLARRLPRLVRTLTSDGVLWISWPKRSSGVTTDLTENVVRDLGLAAGVVDIKVCAVDATWSALKFVRRLRDRLPGSR